MISPFERAPRVAAAKADAMELVRRIRAAVEDDAETDLIAAAALLAVATEWRDAALDRLWIREGTLLAWPGSYYEEAVGELAGLSRPTIQKRHRALIVKLEAEGRLICEEGGYWTWADREDGLMDGEEAVR